MLDGEIIIPIERRLSFEALQLRLHPAASRVNKLAAEHPAIYIAFDLLVGPDGKRLTDLPFTERRKALEAFLATERGDLGSHEPCVARPAEEAEREDDVPDTRSEHGGERDREEEPGKG